MHYEFVMFLLYTYVKCLVGNELNKSYVMHCHHFFLVFVVLPQGSCEPEA